MSSQHDLFTRAVDYPNSPTSAFHQLLQLFLRIASTPSQTEVVDNLAGFLRAILLTAIVQDDMDTVHNETFFELCRTADAMSTSICLPGSEPWNTPTQAGSLTTDPFIVRAHQYTQYWQNISNFQLNRSKAITSAASLLHDHGQDLRKQTCRMYDPYDIAEADGLRHLLDCLQRSDDFIAREYIGAHFGDFISYHSCQPQLPWRNR